VLLFWTSGWLHIASVDADISAVTWGLMLSMGSVQGMPAQGARRAIRVLSRAAQRVQAPWADIHCAPAEPRHHVMGAQGGEIAHDARSSRPFGSLLHTMKSALPVRLHMDFMLVVTAALIP